MKKKRHRRVKTWNPMEYHLQNYLIENRDVRLVRMKDGWRFMGPTGIVHRGARLPGTGRYHTRTIEHCLDSLCRIEARDENGRPDVVGLTKDLF